MTTWKDLEVGSRIIWDGGEFEGEHIVRVLKRGGLSVRAVLEPVREGKVAKIGVRVRLSDTVEMPEGAEAPDRAGNAIAKILGGEEVASMELGTGNDTWICPPVGVTTVAAHLRILHGVELEGLPERDEQTLLRVHAELHEAPFHAPPYPHRHEKPKAEEAEGDE